MGQEYGRQRSTLQANEQTEAQAWIFVVCNSNALAFCRVGVNHWLGYSVLYRSSPHGVLLCSGARSRRELISTRFHHGGRWTAAFYELCTTNAISSAVSSNGTPSVGC